MSDTFVCSMCGGEFEKGWSDEEALAEKDRNWGSFPLGLCALVCDDCHKAIGLGDEDDD